MRKLYLALVMLLAFSASHSHAQEYLQQNHSLSEERLEEIDIFLHTVEVGNLVYNNFGHTAIRVRDKSNGSDIVYNWGIFEFGNPLVFAFQFYRGILYYKLGAYPYAAAMRAYKRELRTVWEDRILFNPDEKRIFLKRLAWNMQPENRSYAYQYFFDNCSTRPRDYFDEALGGALAKSTQQVLTPHSFRDLMIEGYQYNPGIDVLLDLAMNSRLDRLMSQWETMFHPIHFRDMLLSFSQKERALLGESKVVVEFPRPSRYPHLAHSFILIFGALPLAGVGIAFYRRRGQISSFMIRSLALFSLPWVLFAAIVGFIMPLTWLVSAHLDLHHNANILLFWPTDFILVVWVCKLLRTGAPLPQSRFMTSYLMTHILVSLLLPVLRILGLITQNVDRVSVFLLPPYLVVLLLLLRVGMRKE